MTIRMQEAEAASQSFASILERLAAGDDVLVERDGREIAVVRSCESPVGRHIDDVLAILRRLEAEHGPAMMTPDFAADVREAHEFWNQPIQSPWD